MATNKFDSGTSPDGLQVFAHAGRYGVMLNGRPTCRAVFREIRRLSKDSRFFALGIYPIKDHVRRVTVIDRHGQDMNVQLFGEVTQEGDFFRSDNSTPLPLYWDSVSGTYSYEKPYIKEVGGLQLISTMDGNWMLRRGTGRVSPRFLDNELLYNNHIVVVRDYLIVKGKRTKLVKDAKDHAYRIRGFMADSIVVESEEEYGFLQIMADDSTGTRYKRIPIEARMIPDMKSLGLSRTKKE